MLSQASGNSVSELIAVNEAGRYPKLTGEDKSSWRETLTKSAPYGIIRPLYAS